MHRAFGTAEKFLDHDTPSGFAETPLAPSSRGSPPAASSSVCATITPLPSASPSALITIGKSRFARRKRSAASSLSKIAAQRRRECHFCASISFAKIFEDSSRAADFVGPKTRSPSRVEQISNAGRQQIIRSDDGQIDAVLFCEPRKPRQIARRDRDILADFLRPGIPRREKTESTRG